MRTDGEAGLRPRSRSAVWPAGRGPARTEGHRRRRAAASCRWCRHRRYRDRFNAASARPQLDRSRCAREHDRAEDALGTRDAARDSRISSRLCLRCPGEAGAYDESFFTPRELTHLGAVLCGEDPRGAKPTPRSPCIAQRGSPAPRSCLPEPFLIRPNCLRPLADAPAALRRLRLNSGNVIDRANENSLGTGTHNEILASSQRASVQPSGCSW